MYAADILTSAAYSGIGKRGCLTHGHAVALCCMHAGFSCNGVADGWGIWEEGEGCHHEASLLERRHAVMADLLQKGPDDFVLVHDALAQMV